MNVKITDGAGNTVASGTAGTGSTEDMTFAVTANSTYYIKVYGYSGAYSTTSTYTLGLGNIVSQSFETLNLNSPIDVDIPAGQYKVYRFTPSHTVYNKIFTGPYGGTGSSNDTILELYSDSNLSNKITSNDDSNGTLFSTIRRQLTAGTTYYVKLLHYSSSQAVHARLTAIEDPDVTTINLDSPIDVQVAQKEYKVFKFTPSAKGKFKIYTGPYAGTGGPSDTFLHLYDDANLTSQIDSNDDANGTFSEMSKNELEGGRTYYIKFRGYNDGSASARLTINNIYYNKKLFVDNEEIPYGTYASARKYTNGKYFINLQYDTGNTNLKTDLINDGFVEGTDFIVDKDNNNNEMIFIESSAMARINNGQSFRVSVQNDQVYVDVIDGYALLALPDDPALIASLDAGENQVNQNTTYDYTFVISAGMITDGYWISPLIEKLKAKYGADRIATFTAYPYGKTSSTTTKWQKFALFAKQAAKITADNTRFAQYGSTYLKNLIKNNYNSGKIILIGHSAGGFASVETMRSIQGDSNFSQKVSQVIEIGSPISLLESIFSSWVVNISDYRDPVPHLDLRVNPYTTDFPPQDSSTYLTLLGLSKVNPLEYHWGYWYVDQWTKSDGIQTTNFNETLKKIENYLDYWN